MKKYLPVFIAEDDMLLTKFWVEFLFRHVSVFDKNEDFNYNEKYETLGSSLMEIMLKEVDHLFKNNHNNSWTQQNH